MAKAMHTVVTLFCFLMIGRCHSQVMSSNFFEESDLCDANERVDRGCSSTIPNARSRLECYSLCGRDKSCIGASLGPNGLCFHHKECPILSGCSKQNQKHRFMTKYCAHGTWDMSAGSCQCVDGFFGDRCKQCPEKCHDLIDLGYPEGRYRVYTDPSHNGQKPFITQCYINPPSYSTAVLFSNRGVHDFNKTWTDYVNGFYYDNANFWLGLYAFYRLCQSNDVMFAFQFRSRATTPSVHREHYSVSVSDESSGYSFTLSSSRPGKQDNAPEGAYFGQCLEPLENVRFSTWDSDHDENADENCAAKAGSGWWYKGCNNPCNALGLGLKHLNKIARKRIMSLKGVDTDSMASEEFRFYMYLKQED